MFKRITRIKVKLLMQYGFIILLSVLLMAVTLTYIQRILNYQNYRNEALDLQITILQMRRAEKDFMLRELTNENFFKTGKSDYLETFRSLHDKAVAELKDLEPVAREANFDSIRFSFAALDEYKASFERLVELSQVRGFKDFGMEGKLRAAIHHVEDNAGSYDTVAMLMLRRHEKDFFLRKDLSYIGKFGKTVEKFRATHQAPEIRAAIDEYERAMKEIVKLEEQIGLTEQKGVKGRMRAAIRLVEPVTARVETIVAERVDAEVARAYVILIILFIAQFVIAINLALVFSNAITRSIRAIQQRVESLADGKFPDKIAIDTNDEVGGASRAINNLIDRVRIAADFASSIGKGDLTMEYDKRFNNDVLATSLQEMQLQLKRTEEEGARRNWITTGIAQFGNLLGGSNNDTAELARRVIADVVKYTGSAQGQLYLTEDNEGEGDESLVLKGTYAWGKTRHLEGRIGPGSGVVGQAWLEKSTQHITEVPTDYIKITSGLGEALPKSILVVPMKVNDEVHGILELASFTPFVAHKIEFIERLAELLGSHFATAKVNQRTQELLRNTQQQAEELRAQEEEMRQNQEEMQATQEEMNRQRKELEDRIAELTSQLKGQQARSERVKS